MPDKLSIIPMEMTYRVTKCTANYMSQSITWRSVTTKSSNKDKILRQGKRGVCVHTWKRMSKLSLTKCWPWAKNKWEQACACSISYARAGVHKLLGPYKDLSGSYYRSAQSSGGTQVYMGWVTWLKPCSKMAKWDTNSAAVTLFLGRDWGSDSRGMSTGWGTSTSSVPCISTCNFPPLSPFLPLSTTDWSP